MSRRQRPSALPWAVMHFWESPGRKEARTEKALDGTDLLAGSAAKPIPAHGFAGRY